MSIPEDTPQVVNALRLGLYIAEVRGRNRPNGPKPPRDKLPDGENHVLPLRIERGATELRIEAQAILKQLSVGLHVDTFTVDGQEQSWATLIDEQARALAKPGQGTAADAGTAWDALAESIFKLDAHIQDTLTAQSEMQAAAYQFGRGLAEVYWALDPGAACDPMTPDCWMFLLGDDRCKELTRLVGRLSIYFNPYCPPAIAGTLCLWNSVAKNPNWRDDAQDELYRQLRRWYELLILGQDPSTLIQRYTLLRNWQASVHALRALWIPLVTAVISLLLVVWLIYLIATGSATPFFKALLGVLGVVGLSATTILAGLKTTAQRLLSRLRQDAYTDLVAFAIAEAPSRPDVRDNPHKADKVKVEEVRRRTLTAVADAPVP
jgi:hypothetical protein